MWPRFIGDLRQRLLHELPLDSPVGDQIGLYFAFRERFQALKAAFGIASWELEHFLLWQKQQEHEKAKAPAPTVQQSKPLSTLNEVSRRLRLLWFLAQIGHKVGCQVWITRQDQEKSWQEDVLGHLSVPALPSSGVLHGETLLEDIAVLWILKEEIVAAYEIITTDENLIPSLMHLYDLSLAQARRRTRCCLILLGQHVEQALQALARPLFRQQQGRHPCALIREEDLTQHGEHILRWANSPGVIEDMIAFSLEAWNEYVARREDT